MEVVGKTDVGLVRKENQDSYFISEDKEMPLFIIADGMGGRKGGEVASEMAVESCKKIFKENKDKLKDSENIKEVIKEAIRVSNNEIYKESLEKKDLKGMGTTLIIAYVFDNKIYLGHVGDSRVYCVNTDMKQLTEDHSLVNELIKNEDITKEESRTHPKKNIITKAVGTRIQVEPDLYEYKYNTGDRILICTDGLTDMATDDEIDKVFNTYAELIDICNNLIDIAIKNGGRDNITAIIIEF